MKTIKVLSIKEKLDGLGFPYSVLEIEGANAKQPGVALRSEISIPMFHFLIGVTDARRMLVPKNYVGKTYQIGDV